MKLTGRILLSTLALVAATVVAGTIVSKLPFAPPASPPGTTPAAQLVGTLVGSLVLVVGLVPLVSGIAGRFAIRWLALGLLLFVTVGVNTTIELTIFSIEGGTEYMLAFYFLCFVVASAALARLFDARQPVPPMPRHTLRSWLWRVGIAWLAFPVIYFVFGMCVAPFVIPIYQAGVPGLHIPPLDVILRTQLLRSLLFLGSSLPVIMLWTRSRRSLLLALGLAHTVMVGLYGLSQASWMPLTLRVAHSLEITADSFVYALALAWLFVPRGQIAASPSPAMASEPSTESS